MYWRVSSARRALEDGPSEDRIVGALVALVMIHIVLPICSPLGSSWGVLDYVGNWGFWLVELSGLVWCYRLVRPRGGARFVESYVLLFPPTFLWLAVTTWPIYGTLGLAGLAGFAVGDRWVSEEAALLWFNPRGMDLWTVLYSLMFPAVQALWIRRSLKE